MRQKIRIYIVKKHYSFFLFSRAKKGGWRESPSQKLGKKEKSPLAPVFPMFSLGKKGGKKGWELSYCTSTHTFDRPLVASFLTETFPDFSKSLTDALI